MEKKFVSDNADVILAYIADLNVRAVAAQHRFDEAVKNWRTIEDLVEVEKASDEVDAVASEIALLKEGAKLIEQLC